MTSFAASASIDWEYNVPLLSKTVIVDVADQAQTISSVSSCERFPRHRAEGTSSPLDYLVGRRQRSPRSRTDLYLKGILQWRTL
jgi:hypothetical protein